MALRLIRQRRPFRTVNAAAFALIAWIGVVITPCAMAWVSSATYVEQASADRVHMHSSAASAQEHCPQDSRDAPMLEGDCCCELTLIPAPDAPDLTPHLTAMGAVIDVRAGELLLASTLRRIVQSRPVHHEHTPLVYFATRRLRI
jgi:hypothetical protein